MKTLTKLGILITIGTLTILMVKSMIACNTVKVYDVRVTEKTVKRSHDTDKYIIFTELASTKEIRVFKNTDSYWPWFWKTDSSDMYAKIRGGKCYRLKVYGLRFKLLSWYENILEITPIPCK